MNVQQVTHQVRANDWAERIRDQQASGYNITVWCEMNNVSKTQFYYWKRKLKESYLESQLPDIIPVTTALPSAFSSHSCISCTTNTTFDTMPNSSIKISFGDVSIELPQSTSCDYLASLIKAVRYA